MPTPYESSIREIAPDYDPHHVEAFMRLEHSTLDGLSAEKFRAEVGIAVACIKEGGTELAERVAQSFGF